VGACAAARMIAGTLVVLGPELGPYPGFGMKRGTLLHLARPQRELPSFADCGRHDLGFLRLLLRDLRAPTHRLPDPPPPPAPRHPRPPPPAGPPLGRRPRHGGIGQPSVLAERSEPLPTRPSTFERKHVMPDRRLRPGEVAVDLPEIYDAGLYFIGRIRTPWA